MGVFVLDHVRPQRTVYARRKVGVNKLQYDLPATVDPQTTKATKGPPR